MGEEPLRVALLAYRGNPHCGGQGVYIRHLSRELAALGHHVEVLSGPPYPDLDPSVRLVELPSLDFYRADKPLRKTVFLDIRGPVDLLEYLMLCTAAFPEPLTFSIRAWPHLRRRVPDERMAVVPVGVDHLRFRPLSHVARVPGRLMTTASADVPMKGLAHLLEAVAKLRTEREVELVVIGKPREESGAVRTIDRLG